MNAKSILKGILAHNILRHRQHHRFMRNLGMQLSHFGPGRGLLVVGAIALAGRFLQKKRAAHAKQLPGVEGSF